MNGVNLNTNVSNAKKAQESKPQEEAKPQLKEHCSSKAGLALKNVALGVMLAASVIAGAKAATVPARAAETIRSEADPNANIIVGMSQNEEARDNGEIQVTVIATGFDRFDEETKPQSYGINKVFDINTKKEVQQKTSDKPVFPPTTEKTSKTQEFKADNSIDIPAFLRDKKNHG